MANKAKQFYEFGHFRIDPDRRLLLRENQPIPLQSKALDVLLALVENSERVVSKDELLKTVWPDTFVEESNLAQHIFVLRKTLGDVAGGSRYIVTVPGRGYRFAEKVQMVGDKEEDRHGVENDSPPAAEEKSLPASMPAVSAEPASAIPAATVSNRPPKLWRWILAAAFVLGVGVGVMRSMRRPPLKEADLVLVSDFVNTTGEPIFDDTLKQGLTVKLAESPFFTVVLDAQTRKTLGLMERSPDERVVGPLAREVCQREGAKALIGGSIVRLGNKYVLDLDAMNCLTGGSLAHHEIEAVSQEQVLRQLGQAIGPMRGTLGESLNSIQRFDTPIEQATTKSLPALKAYTEGDKRRAQGLDAESVSFYKMATELDPEFAVAYARLGAVYRNLQQEKLADENLKKAFERREHISEREKFYIQAHYYQDSTGELDKGIETYKLWAKIYPHDWIPFNNLANDNVRIGDGETAVSAGQQALRLNPNHALPYNALALAYQWATRFAEAKAVGERAKAAKLDTFGLHVVLYKISLMEGDLASQQRELEWAKGNPLESIVIICNGEYLLSVGRVREARAIYERARMLSLQNQFKEMASSLTEDEAQLEAELGFASDARARAEEAIRMMPDSPTRKEFAALVFSIAGDTRSAERLAAEVVRQLPLDLFANKVTLVAARANLLMNQKNPAGAITALQPAMPYDFSDASKGETIYYRGEAYLQMHSGKEAAAEFDKILANRGPVSMPYWSLAHLGLARAYALTGDKDKSLAAYREFLQLWNNADRDVPVFKQAKAEYGKLQ